MLRVINKSKEPRLAGLYAICPGKYSRRLINVVHVIKRAQSMTLCFFRYSDYIVVYRRLIGVVFKISKDVMK
jgi:hypothetical protein